MSDTSSAARTGFIDAAASDNPAVQIRTLRAENARLREGLKRYGQHEAYCAFDPPLGVFDLCTCGLSAALTGGPHE